MKINKKQLIFINSAFLQDTKTFPLRRYCVFLLLTFIFLFGIFTFDLTAQEIKANSSQNDLNSDEREVLIQIRITKSFIETDKFAKARKNLNKVIADFPQNKYLDIAYYWLAYTLFQEKQFKESAQIIMTLEQQYPDSNWLNEAESLRTSINIMMGQEVKVTEKELSADDGEEKIFIIQNLLKTDRQKAILIINDILKPNSKYSENLKASVLLLISNEQSIWATEKLIEILKNEKNESLLKQSLFGLAGKNEKKIMPILINFLLENTNQNLIDAALYSIAEFKNETSIDTLVYLAKSGTTDDLQKKSIIWLSQQKPERAIKELENLYLYLSGASLKEQIQISLGEINLPASLKSLINLIDAEANSKLVNHGLEILKQKAEPFVIRYLEKKIPVDDE